MDCCYSWFKGILLIVTLVILLNEWITLRESVKEYVCCLHNWFYVFFKSIFWCYVDFCVLLFFLEVFQTRIGWLVDLSNMSSITKLTSCRIAFLVHKLYPSLKMAHHHILLFLLWALHMSMPKAQKTIIVFEQCNINIRGVHIN